MPHQKQGGKTAIASALLEGWQSRLSPSHRTIIEETWKSFTDTKKWALLRHLNRMHGRELVAGTIPGLAGFAVEEEDHQTGNRLALTIAGRFLTTDGPSLYESLRRYLAFQAGLYQKESELRDIKSEEIQLTLGLKPTETLALGELLKAAHSVSSYHNDLSSWSVRTSTEAETYCAEDGFVRETDNWIAKHYHPETAVLNADRIRFSSRNTQKKLSHLDGISGVELWRGPLKSEDGADTAPFDRKYQVFVSSTYLDLITERKHVMQALLETKCIPSGMELFPAASTEQMDLIHGVIDDCDYYVIIVAGKYGSCSPNGISFTEMEFDYAVQAGKPILAFYHSNIDTLTGDKLEKSDQAREKLQKFIQKIKHQRLCKSWNSAEGLESAIKTAILHSIQSNPRPGWVRADKVPPWSMVRQLEQRIAELEGRSIASEQPEFPKGKEVIKIKGRVRWKEIPEANQYYGQSGSLEHEFVMTWDEIFIHLSMTPGIATNRKGLLSMFTHSLAHTLKPEAQKRAKNDIQRMTAEIDGELFDKILQTFLAQKLLKQVPPPKTVRTKILYWQLAPKGIHRLAELNALRAK